MFCLLGRRERVIGVGRIRRLIFILFLWLCYVVVFWGCVIYWIFLCFLCICTFRGIGLCSARIRNSYQKMHGILLKIVLI